MQDHLAIIRGERELYMAQGRLLTLGQILNLRDELLEEIKNVEEDDKNNILETDTFSDDFVLNLEP